MFDELQRRIQSTHHMIMSGKLRSKLSLSVLGALLLAAQAPLVLGQGLVTDRPDFTESAVTVPVGSLQLEGGGTYTAIGNGHSEFVVGEALARWGINDAFELRFGAPSLVSVSNGNTTSGLSDGSLGAKVQLGPLASGWDVAAIASVSVPVGDTEFSSDEFDPSFIFTAGKALDDKFSVGGQVMASWPTEGGEREFEWGGTIVCATSLGTQTGAFLELAATVPDRGAAPIVAHTGLVYAPSETIQFDIHGGVGLSDTAPDAFIGVGLSARVL